MSAPSVDQPVVDPGIRDGVIVDARPCKQCEYDLRGLGVDVRCPECNYPARDSVAEILLKYLEQTTIRRFLNGMRLLSLSLVVFAVANVTIDNLKNLGRTNQSTTREMSEAQLWAELFWLGSLIGFAVGWWMVSRALQAKATKTMREFAQRTTKFIAPMVVCGAIALVSHVSMALGWDAAWQYQSASMIANLLVVMTFGAGVRLLGQAAYRIPDINLHDRSRTPSRALTVLAIVVVLRLIAATILILHGVPIFVDVADLAAPERRPVFFADLVLILGGIAGFILVFFAVLLFARLSNLYRKRIRAILNLQS